MPEWKDTVNLPRTDFPMKANLPTTEPATLAGTRCGLRISGSGTQRNW